MRLIAISFLTCILIACQAAFLSAATSPFDQPEGINLFPLPQEVRWGQGDFTLTTGTKILYANDSEEDRFASVELRTILHEETGIFLPLCR